ncbi:MAG: helix-hairpin-helix domain-containing protein [Acidimicrobiales bacterium]
MLDIDDRSPDADDDRPRLQRPGPPLSWRDRLEHLADATGSTPSRIVFGLLGAVVALAVGWWLLRPPADPPEEALPFASTTSVLPATSSSESELLVVHVAGAVVSPGLHELPAGSRVADAIAAAGGLTPAADAARINLAAPVSDGERVYVLAVGEQEPPVAVGVGDAPEGAPAGPVNLNTADAEALDALPGVGPATAAAIIEHRGKVGAFTSVDELLDVPGIGEAKLEALRDLVTV